MPGAEKWNQTLMASVIRRAERCSEGCDLGTRNAVDCSAGSVLKKKRGGGSSFCIRPILLAKNSREPSLRMAPACFLANMNQLSAPLGLVAQVLSGTVSMAVRPASGVWLTPTASGPFDERHCRRRKLSSQRKPFC